MFVSVSKTAPSTLSGEKVTGSFRVLSHLDRQEPLFQNKEAFALWLGSFGHVWTQSQSRSKATKLRPPRWGGAIPFERRRSLFCSENTTEPTTGNSGRDMSCRATGGNRLLVIMDSIVSYLYCGLGTVPQTPSLSFVHSQFQKLFFSVVSSIWEICSSAQIIDEAFHLLTALCCPATHSVLVFVVVTLFHNAKRDRAVTSRGRGMPCEGVHFGPFFTVNCIVNVPWGECNLIWNKAKRSGCKSSLAQII